MRHKYFTNTRVSILVEFMASLLAAGCTSKSGWGSSGTAKGIAQSVVEQ